MAQRQLALEARVKCNQETFVSLPLSLSLCLSLYIYIYVRLCICACVCVSRRCRRYCDSDPFDIYTNILRWRCTARLTDFGFQVESLG